MNYLINPQHACAARVTVVVPCLCVCVHVCVYAISFLPLCASRP